MHKKLSLDEVHAIALDNDFRMSDEDSEEQEVSITMESQWDMSK